MSELIFYNKYIDRKPIRVDFDDINYPKYVENIMGKNTPAHLDVVGNLELLNLNMARLGFCGSRKSSIKGLKILADCAIQASQQKQDIAVVSGNAAGADFEAHFNCLNKARGKTILVLPEGINNFRIRKDLKSVWDWERVLVISQFQPNVPWKQYNAMIRNELIVALCRAVIVLEAGDKGGTLDAGRKAINLKIPLYVIEHEDMPDSASGNKMLIRESAKMLGENRSARVTNLKEFFEYMKNNNFPENYPQKELSFPD